MRLTQNPSTVQNWRVSEDSGWAWLDHRLFLLSGCSYMPGASSSLRRFNLHPDVPHCLLSISLDQTELNWANSLPRAHVPLLLVSAGEWGFISNDPRSQAHIKNNSSERHWPKPVAQIVIQYLPENWEELCGNGLGRISIICCSGWRILLAQKSDPQFQDHLFFQRYWFSHIISNHLSGRCTLTSFPL